MEEYVERHVGVRPGSEELMRYWALLHDRTRSRADVVAELVTSGDYSTWYVLPAYLFAWAYDAGEWDLAKEVYAIINARTLEYKLLAQVRAMDNWPIYQELLLVLRPDQDDGADAVRGGVRTLQIYLENTTPDQEWLLRIANEVLDERPEDQDGVIMLRMILPLIRDKELLQSQLSRQTEAKQSRYVGALLAAGVTPVSASLLEQYELATWELLRNRGVWPDLPYRIVLGLQHTEQVLHQALAPTLSRNLARYVREAL